MDVVTGWTAGATSLALLAAAPAQADPVARWRAPIEEAAVRFGIPTRWIERVMRAESGGRTTLGGRPIRSSRGAIGLMQLMPGTWADMRARLSLGLDPDDPRDNILAGAGYLRLLYDRFGYPGLFAAYNAGPARYARHLRGARLPQETLAYLAVVDGRGAVGAPGANRAAAPPSAVLAPSPLFAIRRDPSKVAAPQPEATTAQPIFALVGRGS
jgi:soluble lytic murein transglycosylase-like protein